ncbi:DEAD/DEAH box helicase [Candidatus Kaiserbacteria bacterium]|nr:DEAD/DEAH box helicase [Candidatus Kaiserbacteria bacterium]
MSIFERGPQITHSPDLSGSAPEDLPKSQEQFPLYDYQEVASEKTVEALLKTGKALIDMATGLGKTRVGIDAMEKMQARKVLVLADTRRLLKDHKKTFDTYFGNSHSSGFYTGQDKSGKDCDIVFATRQTMREHKEEFSPEHFDLIIDDESHHAKAETYEPTLQYFNPRGLIGMTATPDRMDWKDIREIFGPPVVSHTLEEAMRKGWLTPVDYRLVTENIDQEALEKLLEQLSKDGTKITPEGINEIIFKKKSLEENLDHLVNTMGSKQTAIMCDSIEEAERTAFILRERGYLAEAMHSKSDEDDEELDRFSGGTTQFVCAVNMLNEGIDVPEMEAVAFLRPTDSKTIFLQQLGRVLRKHPGKEKALVLDYVGSIERLDIINQIMRDIKSGESERNDELYFDTTLIGGENVFTFDEKIVSKLAEILKNNERRYASYEEAKKKIRTMGLLNPFDYFRARKNDATLPRNPSKSFNEKWEGWHKFLNLDRSVKTYTVPETKKYITGMYIYTREQYALFTLQILEENRRLPSLQELTEQRAVGKLGFKNIQEAQKEVHDSWDSAPLQFLYEVFPEGPSDGIWRSEAKGVSEYIMTREDLSAALDELIALGRGTKKPWHLNDDHEGRESKEWLDLYGITTVEQEGGAREHMKKILDKMQRMGVLTKELFLPENYYALCEVVLSDIVDPYGAKSHGVRWKTPPKLHSWSPPA